MGFQRMFGAIILRRNNVILFIVAIIIGIVTLQRTRQPSYPHLLNQLGHIVKNSSHENEITIVITYFPLSKAKHDKSRYIFWLRNFLLFCQSPMVIFTSAELRTTLYRLRKNGSLPSFFIVDYQSPLQMPPIKPLVSTFEQQHQIDPERAYHSVELYAVWCAKTFMLNRSVELNPFGSKYFLYVDAGAFRSPNYQFQKWPDYSFIRTILQNQRFLLGMIAPLPRRFCPLNYTINEGPIKMDLIEGTFMAGSISAVRWWTSVFYKTIHEYRSRNFFVGKDQYIMNAIALTYADRLSILLPFRVPCDDVWFAFGPLFAQKIERQKLSYSVGCQEQNSSQIVISFHTICKDERNLV